jgi:5'(3')-deoxyribonucleotidase
MSEVVDPRSTAKIPIKGFDFAAFCNFLSELFDTYILSTAPWENPSAWSDKLEWVKRHLGAPAHKRLILSHNKHLNAGHYLVDDRSKNGAKEFGDVPDQEWIQFDPENEKAWHEVVAYLQARSRE